MTSEFSTPRDSFLGFQELAVKVCNCSKFYFSEKMVWKHWFSWFEWFVWSLMFGERKGERVLVVCMRCMPLWLCLLAKVNGKALIYFFIVDSNHCAENWGGLLPPSSVASNVDLYCQPTPSPGWQTDTTQKNNNTSKFQMSLGKFQALPSPYSPFNSKTTLFWKGRQIVIVTGSWNLKHQTTGYHQKNTPSPLYHQSNP